MEATEKNSSATIPEADAETLAAIQDSEDVDVVASEERPLEGKNVFISYKRGDTGEAIAAMLYQELSELGAEVYLDQERAISERWEEAIQKALEQAHFVIALLTQQTNASDWVKFELDLAYRQFESRGEPAILPIGLGIEVTELAPRIGARVAGFNARSYNDGDRAEILTDVVAAIQGLARPAPSAIALESALVTDFRKNITRASTIDSPDLDRALADLLQQRLVWVVGDDDVRNHFARSLAVKALDAEPNSPNLDQQPNLYEIPRSFTWSKVNDQLIRNAIIIFPDVILSILFDEESPHNELKALKHLIERNLVVITLSPDAYVEIQYQVREHDFESGAATILSSNLYDGQTRLEIFDRLAKFLHEDHAFGDRQFQLLRTFLKQTREHPSQQSVINRMSPADIEWFLSRYLPEAKEAGELFELLRRTADLDNEVRSWFAELNDSTRCFVLTVAMLCGVRKEVFWKHYKAIVNRLRKFDGDLSLFPLGISRQRAAPYVTVEGPIDFVDERTAEAIYDEISRNFREYLLELREFVEEISIPEERNAKPTKEVMEKRKRVSYSNRILRTALARIVGKTARFGIDEELTKLLNAWGADAVFGVRDAVTICLEQAVTTRSGAEDALTLLRKWSNETKSAGWLSRIWAAGSALPVIAAANPPREFFDGALGLLQQLATADRPRVKLSISISLRRTMRRLLKISSAATRLRQLLEVLASDPKVKTRINIAEAILEMRFVDESTTLKLTGEWLQGTQADLRWVAMCSLFLWRRQDMQRRNRDFTELLALDALTVGDVIVEVINHKHNQLPIFWESFTEFVSHADSQTRHTLTSALASVAQSSLSLRLLPLLRAASDGAVQSLASEIRAEKWKLMLTVPSDFLVDLHSDVSREQSAGEATSALELLLKPEPEGSRGQLVGAFVSCFMDRRALLYDVLKRLVMIAPTLFEPFTLDVRIAAIKFLFNDPLNLISVLSEALHDPSVAGETTVALEFLVQSSDDPSREELQRALSNAQAMDTAGLRGLLWQFHETASVTLTEFAHEFRLHALEGNLAEPEVFCARVIEGLRDPTERDEMFSILRQLSVREPEGRRRDLIRALATCRLQRQAEVDWLLEVSARYTTSGFFSFGSIVKFFSFLIRTFSGRMAEWILSLNE